MQLDSPEADVFVPDGGDPGAALARTTHLAIGAHQDDIEFMALHGILQCYNDPDRWFTGVTVTDGAGSPRSGDYASYSDEDMKRIDALRSDSGRLVDPSWAPPWDRAA